MGDRQNAPQQPRFRIPSASEIQLRQTELQNQAAIPSFKPTGLAMDTRATNAQESSTSGGATSNLTTAKTAALGSPISRPLQAPQPADMTFQRPTFGPGQLIRPASAQPREPATNRGGLGNNSGPRPRPAPATVSRTNSTSAPQRSKGTHSIVVNSCQRGNGVLNFIKNVPWEYGDIIPDYQVGMTSCALFLSLKYHRLHPEYVYTRIRQLGHHYLLRILLCLVDIEDHQASIRDLTRICVYNNITLILAWSQEEAGRYLETFKAYEHKPPDLIKERVDPDYLSKLTDALTQVKSVNKTDVLTLASAFGSLQNIMSASQEELAQCPGFGEQKVRRLYEAFHQPFLLNRGDRSR
ncbi:DNA repair protein rad10 [Spizellomyces punctatus DAOM BR117]|uniref:DNA excision repair protein ERCC-1 n=1 Tax=Spizellomyces punctatus (strain DAOM BR117) TaxID=645134 RepID=A0A0L0HJX7_SPIPD|nr:DNA repair protein rad10, variant [Spizellomyces punctatus DAOM BR117]XP_016609805.1 DNA repair protein rad10 [Spizellomyces punctatus DAOM BR117]KND01765.1 DNA repair protein rad10, variant [Spizellomyces punctatus DAOM BR117]KND01766.1 DNA repair protein rad10 [Spizellomyces punctatus DAOM BR117]|eukprot:XP_016609804.1 DNA repair protein rad10, variant [Spizellomyces punctatus DAOM BR117]